MAIHPTQRRDIVERLAVRIICEVVARRQLQDGEYSSGFEIPLSAEGLRTYASVSYQLAEALYETQLSRRGPGDGGPLR